MFHMKRDSFPLTFRCLSGVVRAITQACQAFPCDGFMRFHAVVMPCGAFRTCLVAAFSVFRLGVYVGGQAM